MHTAPLEYRMYTQQLLEYRLYTQQLFEYRLYKQQVYTRLFGHVCSESSMSENGEETTVRGALAYMTSNV